MDDLEQVRREAVRVLCQAQAEDRLPLESFEDRFERIKQAPNVATLEAIVADLYEPGHDLTLARPVRAPVLADHTAVGPVDPAEFLRISSVFASTKRAGAWTVPLELHALIIMGELTLDLRDAVFGADYVDIEIKVTLGTFTLIVPAGSQVENEVEETLSTSSYSTRSARGAQPNGLLIRVRGRSFLASVDIKERHPTGVKPASGGLLGKLLKGSKDRS